MHLKRKTSLLILGFIIVVIGIIIGIIPIFLQINNTKKNNKKIDNYIEETSSDKINITEQELLLILEIPKVELRRGVYPLNSSLNTIEKNVTIMKESSLPSDTNGNVILEAHNGTSDISFFNQLHKLIINDQAFIYYKGYKYIYYVDDIYDVKKDGDVEVSRDIDKNTLTLITCKRNTTDRQLVIVLYLLDKEEY